MHTVMTIQHLQKFRPRAKRVCVNQILREAYHRFTKDKQILQAINRSFRKRDS